MKDKNLILIVCDELTGLKYLDEELLKTLVGIQKFKKRCLYFNNHYTNSVPCSAARSILYTGKNTNHTKVTDNVQSSIPWQKSMVTVPEGLKTLGTYYKHLNPKYVGKIHLLQELDPNNYTRYKPNLATENFLFNYDFNNYTKIGDFAYNSRIAFFNDSLVTEQILPSGSNKNKCDYYDEINNTCLDGAIPYMKNKISSGERFVLCCNYDNPHDILYSNIKTDVPNLLSITGQISGSNPLVLKNIETVGNYNNNYTKYSNLELFNSKSVVLDNCYNSLTNADQLNIGVLIQILSKYYYYGINYFNINQYQEYQTAYYRCLKQVDEELSKLYDFIEVNGLFENSIVCLTSDHGDYVCAHGLIQKAAPIYNPGSSVPLFISYPNMPCHYKNYSSEIITSHINLLPTLMTLSGFDYNYIKSEGLANPFIGPNGHIIDIDYKVVYLFLSITFGALLDYTANNIDNPDAVNDLVDKNLSQYTSLTIQGFSVCSKFIYNNHYINCGYYFSLLHVFIETIKYYANKDLNIFNFDFEPKTNIDDSVYILQDKNNSVPFAFIGKKSILYFQMYTDPIVINNFHDPVIVEYNYTTSPYTKYLFQNPIYGTYIVGVNTFNTEPKFFSNTIGDNFFKNECYVITDETGESNIIYVGNYKQLSIILNDDDNVKKLIKNPIITNKLSDKFVVTNYIYHPIINDIYICFNKLTEKNVSDDYSKFNSLNKILINITIHQKYEVLNGVLLTSKTKCVQTLIYNLIKFYNTDKKLRLPGVDFKINELIKNNYQVQLFDNTDDFDEIINLVDSSRINDVNPIFINGCYQTLYSNIKYNQLQEIHISLPSEFIFETILDVIIQNL
jgi:hypothetical protein